MIQAEADETPTRYVLVESDRFEADRDRAILSVNRILGPRTAGDWAAKLSRDLSALLSFPGPLSHARDEEASIHYKREVRRLLFYGSARRRSSTPVRILFALLPPASDDPPETAETVIFLLRLLHGAQSLLGDDPEP